MSKSVQDLTGVKFGKLTVIVRDTRDGFDTGQGAFWLCQCECPNIVTVRAGNLTSGNTKSCGCVRTRKRQTNYELTRPRAGDTKLSWELMIGRCYNRKFHNYSEYGGRLDDYGNAAPVTVCGSWRYSYENFYKVMGERPLGKTLDRFPNCDGNYEPGNCRWATPKEQANNRRDNVIVEHEDGRKKTFKQWCEEGKLAPSTLEYRLNKKKMTLKQALETTKYSSLKTVEMKEKFYRNRKSNVRYPDKDGILRTLIELEEMYGIKAAVISARIRRRGMTPLEAISTPCMPRGQRHLGMAAAVKKE